jgi:hypothetical protein
MVADEIVSAPTVFVLAGAKAGTSGDVALKSAG